MGTQTDNVVQRLAWALTSMDADTRSVLLHEGDWALAWEIHERTGLPVVGIGLRSEHGVPFSERIILHIVVQSPSSDEVFDARGLSPINEVFSDAERHNGVSKGGVESFTISDNDINVSMNTLQASSLIVQARRVLDNSFLSSTS